MQQDEHADEFHGLSHEELWKSQITPLTPASFQIIGFLLGMGILLALEGMKKTMEQRVNPACAMGKGERMV